MRSGGLLLIITLIFLRSGSFYSAQGETVHEQPNHCEK